MLHGPSEPAGEDHAIGYKVRVGAWMFLLYAIVYGGFVVINVVSPLAMERTVLLGLNLAVVYGIVLIVFAFVLAAVYARICANRERGPGRRDAGVEG